MFVFDNDHPCVGPMRPGELETPPGIYRNRPATGIARVVCYSPQHNVTLAELDVPEIDQVLLDAWREQYLELGARPEIDTRADLREQGRSGGRLQPASARPDLRHQFRLQDDRNRSRASPALLREHRRVLFQDIIGAEREDGRRMVFENDSAIVFLPYFARYAYECYVAPKATHAGLATLSRERAARPGRRR